MKWLQLFRSKRESPDILDNAGLKSVVLLNSDDEVPEPLAVEWLYRCIFKDPKVLCYVRRKFHGRVAKCKTFRQINELLVKELQAKSTGSRHRAIATLAYKAVLEHQETTRKNNTAYSLGTMNSPHSGIWPHPMFPANGRSLYEELPFRITSKIIKSSTRLVSCGSCFAVEIARELQERKFNYVITERNAEGRLIPLDAPPGLSESSAGWGIIFNSPSFRQLIERSYGLRSLPAIIWSDKDYFRDPFREDMKFVSVAEYRDNYNKHIEASRKAFDQAEVLIITLGLNEVWYFKMDGSVFSRSPWRMAPSFVEYKSLTVEENVRELQLMLDILRRFNPGIKVIISLSPVPFHATFQREKYHVVEANTHSKSVLRLAAQEFVEANEGVYYFPSYELVIYGCKEPWDTDQRHVSRATVKRVMEMFQAMFVK